MCSVATGQCPSSSISGWQFNSHYDCVNAGYGVAQKTFQNLAELEDIDRSLLGTGSNRFVLVFDETSNAFKFVNPDEVVNASAGGASVPGGAPNPVGFTSETIAELDTALDNKIDLDAGTF